MKKKIILIAKYVFALIPIIWIFSKINIRDFSSALANIASWTFPVIIIIGLVLIFLQGVKWWILLRAFTPDLSLMETLSYHFKGMYYSIALPTSAAQDVVRTVLISKKIDYSVSWGATWIARITGLIVLVAISLYGVISIDRKILSPTIAGILALISVAIVLLTIFSFSKRTTQHFRVFFSKVLPKKTLTVIENVRDGIYIYRNKKQSLIISLLITLSIQMLFIFNAVLIIKGITGKFYILECMTYIPLIEIICISLPLTPNGIGIRDALTALMFHQIALPPEQLASYIILGFIPILLKLVGVFPVIWDTLHKRKL